MSGVSGVEGVKGAKGPPFVMRLPVCCIDLDRDTDEEVLTDIDDEDDHRIDPSLEFDYKIMSEKGLESVDPKTDSRAVKKENGLDHTFKLCINGVIDDMSSDLKDEIIDEKVVQTESQTPFKVEPKSSSMDQSFESESKTKLNMFGQSSGSAAKAKSNTIGQSSSAQLKTYANASVGSRHYFPAFNYRQIDRKTGFLMNDKPNGNSSEKRSSVRYLCRYCEQEYRSRKDWRQHYDTTHPKLCAIYVKYRKFKDKKCNKSRTNVEKWSQTVPPIRIKLSSSGLLASTSSKSSKSGVKPKPKPNGTRHKKLKTKAKNISETKDTNSKESIESSSGSGGNGVGNSGLFRILPQCNICSFIPMINPIPSIKEHIRKEHNNIFKLNTIRNSYKDFYNNIMVKEKPKTT